MSSKVYYNSACPVCNAGIKDQRRRMEACSIKDIEWIDVHSNPDALSEVGASLEQVRERLYVRLGRSAQCGSRRIHVPMVTNARPALACETVAVTRAQATYALGV